MRNKRIKTAKRQHWPRIRKREPHRVSWTSEVGSPEISQLKGDTVFLWDVSDPESSCGDCRSHDNDKIKKRSWEHSDVCEEDQEEMCDPHSSWGPFKQLSVYMWRR